MVEGAAPEEDASPKAISVGEAMTALRSDVQYLLDLGRSDPDLCRLAAQADEYHSPAVDVLHLTEAEVRLQQACHDVLSSLSTNDHSAALDAISRLRRVDHDLGSDWQIPHDWLREGVDYSRPPLFPRGSNSPGAAENDPSERAVANSIPSPKKLSATTPADSVSSPSPETSAAALAIPPPREADRTVLSQRAGPPPPNPSCESCGATPSIDRTFKHRQGWVLFSTEHTIHSRLCRNCALAVGRWAQNRTLWTGWWGARSALWNLGHLYINASALRDVDSMPPPRGALAQPLDPGRSVFRRGGVWFAIVAVAIAVLALVSAVEESNRSSYQPPRLQIPASTPWIVGNCVELVGQDSLVPVSCTSKNDGVIVDFGFKESECPAATDWWVADAGKVFCIVAD